MCSWLMSESMSGWHGLRDKQQCLSPVYLLADASMRLLEQRQGDDFALALLILPLRALKGARNSHNQPPDAGSWYLWLAGASGRPNGPPPSYSLSAHPVAAALLYA